MVVLRILLGIACILWIKFLWSRRKYYKLMFQLPGQIGLPLIGDFYKFRKLEDLIHYSLDLKKKYEFPVLCWAGSFPLFICNDPITAQDILTSTHCINRGLLCSPISEIMGDGLISLANSKWSLHRRWLNPAFSPTNIRSFVPIFNEKTKAFLKEFEVLYRGKQINVSQPIFRLVMNITLQTTMGLKGDDDTVSSTFKETEDKLCRYYHYFFEKIVAFIVMPWLRLDIVQKIAPSLQQYKTIKSELNSFFTDLIHKKCEILSANDKTVTTLAVVKDRVDNIKPAKQLIFIDLAVQFLRNGQFTAKDVEDHSNHIIAAASETTAATITHVLILLAMNPQYQHIAFEELLAIYPDRFDVTVTDENLQCLVYLEMVINETMRLIPTIPIVPRETSSDVTLSSGIVLPAGVQIVVDMFNLHRNESIWGPNALVFNPENFLPENLKNKHPYAFIPFAKGIRTCIGGRYGMVATKIVLAQLLRKYHFTTNDKLEELRFEPAVSMRLIDPPLVKFHLREK